MDENEDHLITRDNLKLAQDHAAKNQRNPHLVALERKLRTLEKEVEIALGHWGASLGLERKEDKLQVRPIVLRRRRERIKSQANWKLFYYKFNKNHTSPSLLWNHQVFFSYCIHCYELYSCFRYKIGIRISIKKIHD